MKILLLLISSLFISLCVADNNIPYYDYVISVPEEYSVFDDDPLVKNDLYIVNKDRKAMLVLEKIDKTKKRFFPLTEYGKNTHRELLYELFSDIPTNNKAVLEIRETDADFKLQKFEITENNGFVFFRIDNPMDSIGTTKFLISSPLNDEVLDLYFTDKADDKFINSVIKSLKLKIGK